MMMFNDNTWTEIQGRVRQGQDRSPGGVNIDVDVDVDDGDGDDGDDDDSDNE